MSKEILKKGQQPEWELRKYMNIRGPMPISMRPTVGQQPQRKLKEQVEAYRTKGWIK